MVAVVGFENRNFDTLAREVSKYAASIPAEKFIDIKYSSATLVVGVFPEVSYTALVIYKE
ncbi:hypothetical protein [Paenibacillus periandrae]|uniref:hypothetical protein n=1 Tax=Paenibacillus periandrae TaxID=1761741 RepID=UPI001F093977|nr:hypothetical protein [Paenibacillus periandrae]